MTFRLIAFRVFSLAALSVSGAMLVDYVRPAPVFCSFRAGCEEVVHSHYGRPLGVPLPFIGLAAFALFFGLTLFPASRGSRFLGPLAITAGLIGLALVAVQVFVLRHTCALCLIIDTAAILLAAIELGLPPVKKARHLSAPQRLAWSSLAMLAVAAPWGWSMLQPLPEAPPQLKAHWAAGRMNVVEITDFGCQYCRQTHAALDEFLQQHPGQFQFVRLVAPLDHIENSKVAAKAYLCAARQGQAEPMAHALYTADDLSPTALRRLAADIPLKMDEYDRSMNDPIIGEQIDTTVRWVSKARLRGLPQVWIDDLPLVGVQTSESLRMAARRAKRGKNH